MILPSLQQENSSFVFVNENFSLKSRGKGGKDNERIGGERERDKVRKTMNDVDLFGFS